MNKKAFTLVELLAVLILISIIMVLMVPSIQNVGHNMKVSARDAKYSMIEKAASNYLKSHLKECIINDTGKYEDYYDCYIKVKDLVNKGGYKKDYNASDSCLVSNPEAGCFDNLIFFVKIKKNAKLSLNTGGTPSESNPQSSLESQSTEPSVPENTDPAPKTIEDIKKENKPAPAGSKCTNTLEYDGTSDNNLRYVGENPCNYVKFNNELWRIIGVMNNIDNGNGVKEKRIKLIKEGSIGNYSWDTFEDYVTPSYTLYGIGMNNWAYAKLQIELNGDYLKYKTSGSTKWYNGEKNQKDATYEYKKGLTSESKKLIGYAKWHLGGVEHPSTINAFDLYNDERGTRTYPYSTRNGGNLCSNCMGPGCPRNIWWNGKVALAYASDDVFSVGGSVRSTCLQSKLYGWSKDCKANVWMKNNVSTYWALTPGVLFDEIFTVQKKGGISSYNDPYNDYDVRPAVYLKSKAYVLDGNGSEENPYIFHIKDKDAKDWSVSTINGPAVSDEWKSICPSATTTTPTDPDPTPPVTTDPEPKPEPEPEPAKPTETLVNHIKSIVGSASTTSSSVIKKSGPKNGTCDNTLAYDGNNDKNLRYVGSFPCNYIKFNGETWRIIGVMNNIDNGSGTKQTRVKIVREDKIGNYSFDSSASSVNSGRGNNDYSTSDLKKELNGDYLNYKSSGSTKWYGDKNNSKNETYYYNKGLSSSAKKLTSNAKWPLGGINIKENSLNSNLTNLLPANVYNSERGSSVYSGNSKTWTGIVAIPYISDFGYSTEGGSNPSRSKCLSEISLWGNLSSKSWTSTTYYSCTQGSWFHSRYFQPISHTLTHNTNTNYVFFPSGAMTFYYTYPSNAYEVYPTLYLNANVMYDSGDGSVDNPYIVS